jgi:hypothetical protein
MPAGVAATGASNLEQPIVPPGSVRVYRNDGAGFADATATLGFAASINPRAVAWIDFDNDGDLDLHQMNKGTSATGNEPDILWRNDGSAFAPSNAVPGDTRHLTDGGVWADFDRDGDLDLFLQEGTGPAFFSDLTDPILYRNDDATGHWLEVDLTRADGTTVVGTEVTCVAGSLAVSRRVTANSWRGFQAPSTLHFGLGNASLVNLLTIRWPNGETQVLGPLSVDQFLTVASPTSTLEPALGIASVGAIVPQPGRGVQTVSFTLGRPARLRVDVYDVAGRRVRRLGDSLYPSGAQRIRWAGLDDRGAAVAAGV